MKTTIGEYIVGAYLKLCLGCAVVDYNVRPPSGGHEGLAEFDVVGFDFRNRLAYICEVVTHLDGMNYGGNPRTIERIKKKHQRQKDYAEDSLRDFKPIYMLWSPVVPVGFLTQHLLAMQDQGLQIYINKEYRERVEELKERAKQTTRDIGNPFFRTLQILEHLRG